MPLHDAVGVNFKKATTDIKEQVPSTWEKGCMFDNCACVILLVMTPSPGRGSRSWYIIIINEEYNSLE